VRTYPDHLFDLSLSRDGLRRSIGLLASAHSRETTSCTS
jgi:hypothetical protein